MHQVVEKYSVPGLYNFISDRPTKPVPINERLERTKKASFPCAFRYCYWYLAQAVGRLCVSALVSVLQARHTGFGVNCTRVAKG